MTDFIALAKSANEPNLSQEEFIKRNDELFKALFELPEWFFATDPKSISNPLVRKWEGNDWIFAFTDSKLLDDFLKRENLQNADETLFLSMSHEKALPWFRQLNANGIYGVHFNFAGDGWYIPLKQMDPVYKHLF